MLPPRGGVRHRQGKQFTQGHTADVRLGNEPGSQDVSWPFLSENEERKKRAQSPLPDSHEHRAEIDVLEEIPWGTRPRVGAEMERREKASRAAYGPPDHSQGSVTGDIHSCLFFTVPR